MLINMASAINTCEEEALFLPDVNCDCIEVPDPPKTDGEYYLVATVSNGEATYQWQSMGR